MKLLVKTLQPPFLESFFQGDSMILQRRQGQVYGWSTNGQFVTGFSVGWS